MINDEEPQTTRFHKLKLKLTDTAANILFLSKRYIYIKKQQVNGKSPL